MSSKTYGFLNPPGQAPSAKSTTTRRSQVLEGLLFVVLLCCGLALLFTVVVPRMMGWVPGAVTNQSMTPAYNPGDEIYFKKIRTKTLDHVAVGDVIVYQPNQEKLDYRITRVVEINGSTPADYAFTTKHDANAENDEGVVTGEMVRGVAVYSLPWVGSVLAYLSETSRSILLIFCSMGLLALSGWLIATAQLNARDPKAHARRMRLRAAAAAGRLEADRRALAKANR